MEKNTDWKLELDDLLEDYWGYPDGGTEEGFIRGEMGVFELVEKELDKAREEVLIELQEEFSEFGVPDDVRYSTPLFYINEVIERKLSKLKDNK
jgi:hypothetical protein